MSNRLAKMNIGWNSMSPLLQKSLLQAIGHKYRHFTIDEISDLFLRYQVPQIPPSPSLTLLLL